MNIVNTCAVSKQGRCSVQYTVTVLLLKSDMLADSIYSTPCTTARPAVEYQREKHGLLDAGHEHPGIVADGRRAL